MWIDYYLEGLQHYRGLFNSKLLSKVEIIRMKNEDEPYAVWSDLFSFHSLNEGECLSVFASLRECLATKRYTAVETIGYFNPLKADQFKKKESSNQIFSGRVFPYENPLPSEEPLIKREDSRIIFEYQERMEKWLSQRPNFI
jgi:hypothetical protein